MKFQHLETGDIMELAGKTAVVIAIEPIHPLNPNFMLIVWWLNDLKRPSVDMLAPGTELIPGSYVRQDGMASWKRAITEMCR